MGILILCVILYCVLCNSYHDSKAPFSCQFILISLFNARFHSHLVHFYLFNLEICLSLLIISLVNVINVFKSRNEFGLISSSKY